MAVYAPVRRIYLYYSTALPQGSATYIPICDSKCLRHLQSFKMSQPMPSSSQVTIDLTKEEDRDDALDHRGVTPDYDMEFGRSFSKEKH
jgi:hypothetical protein